MRVSSINSQSFKGLLIIPRTYDREKKKYSPKLEIETKDIIEIDNSDPYCTVTKYMDENNKMKTHKFHKYLAFDQNRVLIAYMAAATQKDIVVKA